MSRAFVKEVDDAPPPPPKERPVSAAPNLVTPRGARLIEQAVVALEEQISAASEEKVLPALRRDLRYCTPLEYADHADGRSSQHRRIWRSRYNQSRWPGT
jgi:hypothetical protein